MQAVLKILEEALAYWAIFSSRNQEEPEEGSENSTRFGPAQEVPLSFRLRPWKLDDAPTSCSSLLPSSLLHTSPLQLFQALPTYDVDTFFRQRSLPYTRWFCYRGCRREAHYLVR